MSLRYRYCNSQSFSIHQGTGPGSEVPVFGAHPCTGTVAGVKDQHDMKREHHALGSRWDA